MAGDELKLSPEQREKMKSIWSEMLPGGPGRGDRHGDSRRADLQRSR